MKFILNYVVLVTWLATLPALAIQNGVTGSGNGKTAYLRQPTSKGYRYCTVPLIGTSCALVPLHCVASAEEGKLNPLNTLEFWVPGSNSVDSSGNPIPTNIVTAKNIYPAAFDIDGFAVIGLNGKITSNYYVLPTSALAAPQSFPTSPRARKPRYSYATMGFGRKSSEGAYNLSNVTWFPFSTVSDASKGGSGLTLFAQFKAPSKSLSSMSETELQAYYESLSWALPGDEGGVIGNSNVIDGIISSSKLPEAWLKAKKLGKADTDHPYNAVIPIYPHVQIIKDLMTRACK